MTEDRDRSEVPKRIAIAAPSAASVLRHRAGLIAALVRSGHSVLVLAPCQLAGEIAAIRELGGEHCNFDPEPPGLKPLSRWRLISELNEALRRWRPNTVLLSGAELAFAIAFAARRAGVEHIVTLVNDLGPDFDGNRESRARGYRRALRWSDTVICHNATDLSDLHSFGLVPDGTPTLVSPGTGIDLRSWTLSPLPELTSPVHFLMIADPAERDAITTFAAAGRELSARGVGARFMLATDREATRDTSILTVSGVEFLGRAQDTAALMSKAHVIVHLSADDGCPTALLEALAIGRPILTLNTGACRTMVDERVNGCLVSTCDPRLVADACQTFVTHGDLLPAEGRASRAKAERHFDERVLLAAYVHALDAPLRHATTCDRDERIPSDVAA
jgi:glycosyltransferase involved in cell wall biosynthesis